MLDSLALAMLGSNMPDPARIMLRTMAIHKTYTQSALEKRLQIIRKQVYGKNISTDLSTTTTNIDNDSEVKHLRFDLFKIGILTSLALGIQIIVYYLIKNNVLKLNLF